MTSIVICVCVQRLVQCKILYTFSLKRFRVDDNHIVKTNGVQVFTRMMKVWRFLHLSFQVDD